MIYVTHDQVEAMTLADKSWCWTPVAWRRLGNRWSCTISGRPFCRRIYRFAKDELPAVKVTATAIDQVQVELPMPNRSKSGYLLKAVMSRLEPICRWYSPGTSTAE